MGAKTLLVLTNGHGEDLIGARLATATQAAHGETDGGELRVVAYPIVGLGDPLAAAGFELLEPRRELPSGGLTMHHPRLLLADVGAGIVSLTLRQAGSLRRSRPTAVLVAGDAYAQALAALVRAPRAVYQPLVSVHQSEGAPRLAWQRLFMDRIRAPELWLLRAAERVYARDEATAAHLRARGVSRARYLGNPMMDHLVPAPAAGEEVPKERAAWVALLPGSRGYRERALDVMLAALSAWRGPALVAEVAWAHGATPAPPEGWVAAGDDVWHSEAGNVSARVRLGAFAEVLATADAVVGTAGTANEQAAGLGLPVVAFPVPPDYGEAFLAGQRRLLGAALEVTEPTSGAVTAALQRALYDRERRRAAAREGPARMGGQGASERIGSELAAWLVDLGRA